MIQGVREVFEMVDLGSSEGAGAGSAKGGRETKRQSDGKLVLIGRLGGISLDRFMKSLQGSLKAGEEGG